MITPDPTQARDALLLQAARLRERIEELETEWGALHREIAALDAELAT